MAEAGITADIFVFLDVPDDVLVERVVGRRTDPETGKIYHMTFNPPESDEIAARLTQRGDDTEEKVKVRLQAFHANIAAIIDCYTEIIVKINGNGDKNAIFDLSKEFIDAAAKYGQGQYDDALSLFSAAGKDAAHKATEETLAAALVGEARAMLALGRLKKCADICGSINDLIPNHPACAGLMKKVHDGAEAKLLRKGSKGLKLIIAGAPASGKGTQCEVIREKYGVVHLSTGDMLRAAAADGTEVGLEAQKFMNEGKLVTDEIIIRVVKERLAHADCRAQVGRRPCV